MASAKCFALFLMTVAALGSGGCLVEEGSADPEDDTTPSKAKDAGGSDAGAAPNASTINVETTEFLRMFAAGGYTKGSGFTEVTAKPYTSAIGAGSIRVWVTTTGADSYFTVDPAKTGSKAWMPRGSVIVRAVLDAAGNPTKLTVMAKGSVGSNPTLGDYWFAVTNPQGVPLPADAGVGGIQAGALKECFSCHLPRAQDDYLFGVPSADRATLPLVDHP
jgi:hypothetical protein